MAAASKDEKMAEVSQILHARGQDEKGKKLIATFMGEDVKLVTSRDKETTKTTLSMASRLDSLCFKLSFCCMSECTESL